MEDNIEDVAIAANESGDAEVKLEFRGYEIKTVRLTLDKSKAATGNHHHPREGSEGWIKL